MNTPARLGAYLLGLAVLFGGALGAGRAADTAGLTPQATPHTTASPAPGETSVPEGLQVSNNGYTLTPRTTTVEPGQETDFRFTVTGPDGRPVTGYQVQHDKKLHFIVVSRDLGGFWHLHPREAGGGEWSVPLTLPAAGAYRAFADFAPEGGDALTLGVDLLAPGDYRPAALPAASRTTTVDGYTVTLDGDLTPGALSKLTLSVAKDGRPVTDLQPYLGAYGHLVALRDGDLAYLHVHPDGEPGDGRTAAGPGITFYTEVPSRGAYRLFLDFQHGGVVRTASFTVRTGQAAAPASGTGEQAGHGGHGGHAH
ncbi:hypothetical protein [Streptosporangium sp. NPDC000239]|uniref:hypothetical protein n=1 Tax=unclassified Streptosporangium TaxID=2632669 RepID=UPI003329A830